MPLPEPPSDASVGLKPLTTARLFLDEIGNIPMEVQEKILRVVEYNAFERVGSSESIEVDVRIIAATNADVKALAARNMFKEDLLDRLSFEVLVVPPLRERGEDIMLLTNYFAGRMAVELEREEIPQFQPGCSARALEVHPWPGNVRELKNVVERAVYRSQSTTISEILCSIPSHRPIIKSPLKWQLMTQTRRKTFAETGDLTGQAVESGRAGSESANARKCPASGEI